MPVSDCVHDCIRIYAGVKVPQDTYMLMTSVINWSLFFRLFDGEVINFSFRFVAPIRNKISATDTNTTFYIRESVLRSLCQ